MIYDPDSPTTIGKQLDQLLAEVAAQCRSLSAEVAALKARKAVPVWEDFGCRANDPGVDNGPLLSKMLAAGGGIAATGGEYHCQTTIEWPHATGAALHGFGGTRIVTKAPIGIAYSGSDCIIQDLSLIGDRKNIRGTGLAVYNDDAPPTGHLTTRNLKIEFFERGFETLMEPKTLHATEFRHYGLKFRGVKDCYNVNGPQSCDHRLYGVDFRTGYQRCFVFRRWKGETGCGGPLNVWGCYVGRGYQGILLDIDRTDSGTGTYEIHGLHLDGWAEQLRLVEHGQTAHRVRIAGNASSAKSDANSDGNREPTIADPPVVNRDKESKAVDIEIDMRGCRWPKEAQ